MSRRSIKYLAVFLLDGASLLEAAEWPDAEIRLTLAELEAAQISSPANLDFTPMPEPVDPRQNDSDSAGQLEEMIVTGEFLIDRFGETPDTGVVDRLLEQNREHDAEIALLEESKLDNRDIMHSQIWVPFGILTGGIGWDKSGFYSGNYYEEAKAAGVRQSASSPDFPPAWRPDE